jgi:hypothetical protein
MLNTFRYPRLTALRLRHFFVEGLLERFPLLPQHG